MPESITPGAIKGDIEVGEQKTKLIIREPTNIVISIKERYTENLVYDCFVKDFEENHCEPLNADNEYKKSIENLKNSLRKGDRVYVINMLNIDKYDSKGDIQMQVSKNFLVLFEDDKIGTLKRVLYQIRSNIVHGEKLPGAVNDDKIVRAAYPVIQKIMGVVVNSLRTSSQ